MDGIQFVTIAAILLLGKVFGIAAGICCIYWGYRLLMAGVMTTSDIKATWGDKSLLLKRATLGAVFCLFGAAVIIVSLTVTRSMDLTPERSRATMTLK